MTGDHATAAPRSLLPHGVLGAAVLCVIGTLVVLAVSRATPSHPFTSVSHGRPAPFVSPTLSGPSLGTGHGRVPKTAPGSALFLRLVLIAFTAAGLAFVVAAVRGLWVMWPRSRVRRNRRRRRPGRPVGIPVADAARGAVADAVADSLEEVLRRGPVADAIIASWLAVESALRRAGMPVHGSDTSAELVERALVSFGVRKSALQSLSELYREARFSTHPLTELHRERARDDLLAVRADLVGTSHAR